MHYSFSLFFSQYVLHVCVSATAQLRVRWTFTPAVIPTLLAMVRREQGDFEVFRLLIPAMAALLNSLMCTHLIALCTTRAIVKGFRMLLNIALVSGTLINKAEL